MREFNENEVILDKDEYRCLKSIEKLYDPFWFCTFGGCEGVCKECKDTCEMSIFVKERKETAEKVLTTVTYRILALNFETENKDYDEGFFDACKEILRRVDHVAKELGVEIKE